MDGELRNAITEGERPLSDDLLWRMCVHEVCHALAAIALRVGTVRTMRVEPRGGLVETHATFDWLAIQRSPLHGFNVAVSLPLIP